MIGDDVVLLVGGHDILDHPGLTAPIDLRSPVISFEIESRRFDLDYSLSLDLKLFRSRPKRDWEQRQKKRRRA